MLKLQSNKRRCPIINLIDNNRKNYKILSQNWSINSQVDLSYFVLSQLSDRSSVEDITIAKLKTPSQISQIETKVLLKKTNHWEQKRVWSLLAVFQQLRSWNKWCSWRKHWYRLSISRVSNQDPQMIKEIKREAASSFPPITKGKSLPKLTIRIIKALLRPTCSLSTKNRKWTRHKNMQKKRDLTLR